MLKFIFHCKIHLLILINPSASCISKNCVKIKINLNFYFQTSSWCLKRFMNGTGSVKSLLILFGARFTKYTIKKVSSVNNFGLKVKPVDKLLIKTRKNLFINSQRSKKRLLENSNLRISSCWMCNVPDGSFNCLVKELSSHLEHHLRYYSVSVYIVNPYIKLDQKLFIYHEWTFSFIVKGFIAPLSKR